MSALPTAVSGPEESMEASPSFGTFEQLYAATRDAVYAYVMGLLRDQHAAEEVTAQAYERAFRRRGQLDRARGDARAWLFGIARNAALDELRRRRRHAEPVDAADLDRLAVPVSAVEVDIDLGIALRQAVAALTPRDRELVALKFWAGLNNREIAAVVDLSESNVGTRLGRITTALRSSL